LANARPASRITGKIRGGPCLIAKAKKAAGLKLREKPGPMIGLLFIDNQ